MFDKVFLKFLLVGLINTCVGAGVMFLLYNFAHFSYWISSAANYIVGGIVSYFLNKYFTFKNKHSSVKQICFFILNLLVCYFVSYKIAKSVMYALLAGYSESLRGNCALFAGMCLYTMTNYIGQRFIVFRKGAE